MTNDLIISVHFSNYIHNGGVLGSEYLDYFLYHSSDESPPKKYKLKKLLGSEYLHYFLYHSSDESPPKKYKLKKPIVAKKSTTKGRQ